MWKEKNENIDLNYFYAAEAKLKIAEHGKGRFGLLIVVGFDDLHISSSPSWQLAVWKCVELCVIELFVGVGGVCGCCYWSFLYPCWIYNKFCVI